MSDRPSDLGVCPFCEESIPKGALIIEYETDGGTNLFAECYQCDKPVEPK